MSSCIYEVSVIDVKGTSRLLRRLLLVVRLMYMVQTDDHVYLSLKDVTYVTKYRNSF